MSSHFYVALCKIIISDVVGSLSSDTFFDHHDALEVSFWINEINQFFFCDCNEQLYKSKYFSLLLYQNFFFAVDDLRHSEILLTLVPCIVSSFSIFQQRASSIGDPVSNILLTVDRERSLSRDQAGSQDLQIFRRARTFTRKPFSVRGV